MTLQEALKKLDIEEYAERIFHSNSHGELFHLDQYVKLAEMPGDLSWFKPWFEGLVKWAEENWERPESIFQHVLRVLVEEHQTNNERH